jgi:hypothetical protein
MLNTITYRSTLSRSFVATKSNRPNKQDFTQISAEPCLVYKNYVIRATVEDTEGKRFVCIFTPQGKLKQYHQIAADVLV